MKSNGSLSLLTQVLVIVEVLVLRVGDVDGDLGLLGRLRGYAQMTSDKILGFWTSSPCCQYQIDATSLALVRNWLTSPSPLSSDVIYVWHLVPLEEEAEGDVIRVR